jgi:hypothetical protein
VSPARPSGGSGIVLYQTEDGRTRIECSHLRGSTWSTIAELAELFEVTVHRIRWHLDEIFADGECDPETCTHRTAGVERYAISVLIAVGLRVQGPRGHQFRSWATERFSEPYDRGLAMDEERLSRGSEAGDCDASQDEEKR